MHYLTQELRFQGIIQFRHFLPADTPDMHTQISIELTDAREFKICNQMPTQHNT
jgi:hypothetical protein